MQVKDYMDSAPKYIKIVRNGERFWVEPIWETNGQYYITAYVRNDLTMFPYKDGDEIPVGLYEKAYDAFN